MVYECAPTYTYKLKRSEGSRDVIRHKRQFEEVCDVEFTIGEKRFPAHRVWVAAASPVIRKLLTNGMKESAQREVRICEVNPDTWDRVMDYVYYEDIEIPSLGDAISLLECARRFQFENLESIVIDFIVENIHIENCFQVLVASDSLGVKAMKEKAMDVIASNFQDVSSSTELALLHLDLFAEIVKNDSLMIRSEFDVLHVMLRWLVKHGYCEQIMSRRAQMKITSWRTLTKTLTSRIGTETTI